MINNADWFMLGTGVKDDIYEGHLERNAADTKSGAGQYFIPHASAMLAVLRPTEREETKNLLFSVGSQ